MAFISITDQHPPANKPVLLKQQRENYKPFVVVGQFIEKGTVESYEDWAEYDEERDEHYCPEGFYERLMNWDEYEWIAISDYAPVIAWMEIPGGDE
ncbi:MAG: hypothetical protein CMI13_07735 [Oleibacter sp.]|nr:hypothetical protein [Thalassolituus sp.]